MIKQLNARLENAIYALQLVTHNWVMFEQLIVVRSAFPIIPF